MTTSSRVRDLDATARRGLAQLRLLDAFARPSERLDASRLAEWERVIRRPRSAGGSTPVEVTPGEAAAPGGESDRAAYVTIVARSPARWRRLPAGRRPQAAREARYRVACRALPNQTCR